jgi:5'-methylthioadenosine phosphorylase
MTPNNIKLGIIGGSGLEDIKLFKINKKVRVKTPYGKTSDDFVTGTILGIGVVLLARHAQKHTISPTKIPYRANIWELKKLGCSHIIATTACCSLYARIKPGDFVLIDQFIDFTKLRKLTFFENKVVHTSMAYPFDKHLRNILNKAANNVKLTCHKKGTVVTIEGPRFSSRAESLMFRKLGADVINMSTVPEVILANEIGIPYQSIAMVTDYDSWKTNEEPVSYEMVMGRMIKNSEKVKLMLHETFRLLNRYYDLNVSQVL